MSEHAARSGSGDEVVPSATPGGDGWSVIRRSGAAEGRPRTVTPGAMLVVLVAAIVVVGVAWWMAGRPLDRDHSVTPTSQASQVP